MASTGYRVAVSCSNYTMGSSAAISITSTYPSGTEYRLSYVVGTHNDVITTTTSKNYTWTPGATFINNMNETLGHSRSGTGTIRVRVYQNGTEVDTATCSFLYQCPDVSPTVGAIITDMNTVSVALTGNNSIIVANLSNPKVTISATSGAYAEIMRTEITVAPNAPVNTSPYTFTKITSPNYTVSATDSRGYTTRATRTITNYVPYFPISIKPLSVARIQSGSTTVRLTVTGKCFKGNFGSVSNTLTLRYRYKTSSWSGYVALSPVWDSDGSFTATTTVSGISAADTYKFEVQATDRVSTVTQDSTVGQSVGDLRIAKDYVRIKNNLKVDGNVSASNIPSGNLATETFVTNQGYITGTFVSNYCTSRGFTTADGHTHDTMWYNRNSLTEGVTVRYSSPSYYFRPTSDNAIALGGSSYRWTKVFAADGTISTSDRNVKTDVQDIDEKYIALFDRLRPVSYKRIDGTSGRVHTGFISQEVEQALTDNDMTAFDFAGFCKDKKIDENGNEYNEYNYALRYEEFIALNTAKIKQLEQKIVELESKLEKVCGQQCGQNDETR